MAISVDPLTDIIYVPKADLTLIQASPEVREIDLNWFRLALRDWEDGEDAIPRPKTHNHSTETTLAGLTYARIIEILAPYTVEFEDGQYTVNCVGANHNISDVKVANQVSLIVNNAAGLITNTAIEYSSFQGAVHLNTTTSYSGTTFPIGTPQRPVNNIEDALLIASTRGFVKLMIYNDLDLNDSYVLDGFVIQGISESLILTIDTIASVNDLTLRNLTIANSVLDGNADIRDCLVRDVSYINGYIHNCGIAGTITLGGNRKSVMADCYTVDQDDPPVVDMNGSGNDLAMPNYSGIVTFINLTNADNELGVGLDAGSVTLDSTITAGSVIVSGVGLLYDNSTGAAVVNTDGIVNKEQIAHAVWDEPMADHKIAGTFGDELATKSDIKASAVASYHSALDGQIIYGTNVSGSYTDTETRNDVYWQVEEDATNGLTVEFTFNINDDSKPGEFSIFGRYEGVPSTLHFINLQAYNYEVAGWEILASNFMPGGNTSDDQFTHEYYERNVDRGNNNEVKIRLVHNVTTYNPTHDIYIDSAIISCIHVETSAVIADAVWAHVDALAIMSDLSFIKGIEGGRWRILNGQMIFYSDDNITELARFDLTYDGDMNPIERSRV